MYLCTIRLFGNCKILWFNFQFSRIDRFGSWSYGVRFYIPFTYDANSIHKFLVKLKIKYWYFSGSRPQVWCCSSRFNSCILFTIAFSLHFYTNYLNKITSARSFCIFYLFEACKQYFKVFRKKKKKIVRSTHQSILIYLTYAFEKRAIYRRSTRSWIHHARGVLLRRWK